MTVHLPDQGAPALHLVRHGQSTWNVQQRIQGQTDEAELTDVGREQARRCADLLAGVKAVRLLTSDLRRAVQSAEIIGAALQLEPIRTSLLREQSFGRLEGAGTERAVAEWEEAVGKAVDVYGDPLPMVDVRVAGGESMRDVQARAGALLATPWVAESTGDVVVVTHGDTIRIILAHLLDDDFDNLPWREVANGDVHSVYRTPTGEVKRVVTKPAG
jgi:probable phosphoglycerate mutase